MLALVHPSASVPIPVPQPPLLHRHSAPSSSRGGRTPAASSSSSNTPATLGPQNPQQQPPPPTPAHPVDIHAYPTADLLRLLASLLTQIASTNDQLAASPAITTTSSTAPLHIDSDTPVWHALTTASRSAISTPASTLTFHARNIPTISLDAYFLRILKYCPTTNEVFLALLVYFDRISKLNADATQRTFVIDSFNIHRLVIAGVTVASKFFSDVFYTNSRYAKVGGLPLQELNQLELQFLLLNDFRLVISSDEMQRYAEQLILFSRTSGAMRGAIPDGLVNTPSGVAAPMSAMGAIDTFGGKVADDDYRTPSHHKNDRHRQEEDDTDDDATSTSGTTDDEPTIKAASVADRGRRRESIDEAMVDPTRSPNTSENRVAASMATSP
ncbi:hypothetical protein AGABI2DRAFT_135089 [Agaricus bisporus var. bisporus H97]|uniref:hypothetical protein n=1 Tax=Agaricus bisporus var. bisporus (strain H97 / ATCC MYA-4626 / FGSC 10389) TaxID=936046 RepID=UPI00029F529F|nr:hypothetical protein AGABI2DRAFT_135089 [Agaricus bisporus var. bisporus H97]EKV47888.1 hypothetical protein AGABI2DRAFT_135089 [Agaricus bisporus var. bisporus H97]